MIHHLASLGDLGLPPPPVIWKLRLPPRGRRIRLSPPSSKRPVQPTGWDPPGTINSSMSLPRPTHDAEKETQKLVFWELRICAYLCRFVTCIAVCVCVYCCLCVPIWYLYVSISLSLSLSLYLDFGGYIHRWVPTVLGDETPWEPSIPACHSPGQRTMQKRRPNN